MQKKSSKINYKKVAVLLSLPLQMLLIQLIASQPLWVESLYTGLVYKHISWLLRFMFGGIPLPVGQLLFYSIIAVLLVWLIKQIKKLLQKQVTFGQFAGNIGYGAVAVVSAFYFLFTVMWGLNYHRRPLPEIVQHDQREMSKQELEALAHKLITLTNESRSRLTENDREPLVLPLTHKQILEKAPLGFKEIGRQYPELKYEQPSVKQVLVPEVMSFFGIVGIYFPFTGEANVNMHPPAYLLPEVVCHEMAHQIGVASEDEANFVAYLACRLHPEPAFQYSGNFMALSHTLNRLKYQYPMAYMYHFQSLSPGVMHDLKANRSYWTAFQNPLEIITDGIHDLFLKANDQEEGLESYSHVVELLIGEYRKNKLEYPLPEPGKSISNKTQN